MEGRERRSIALMAFGFFFLIAFVDTEPGAWRTVWVSVAWIIFLIGFFNMVAERRE
jgi:hypothetical protein